MESAVKSKRLHIGGMTCVNCQNKIEAKLRNTAGVKSAKVSYNDGTAEITYDTDLVSLHDICAVIEKLDYQVLAERKSSSPGVGGIVGMLVIIVSLYVLLQQFGILNLLVPSQLADTRMGYGMLFVVGLITSLHCVAMCGGINLSQCIPRGEAQGPGAPEDAKTSRFSTVAPAAWYNLGRVVSYTAVGFILGAIGLLFGGGSGAGVPVLAQGILKLIAGVFMVVMGINMLGLFPWLRRLQPRVPGFIARRVNMEKARNKSPLIVGLLNGFMPCGPLQSMQIVALASGNPFAGALSMLLFSLGTVPLMLGLGSLVSALGKKFANRVMRVGAVLVVVLGLAMLSQGGSLSGFLPPDRLLAVILALCAVGVVASVPFRKPDQKTASTIAASVVAVMAIAAWSTWSTTAAAAGSSSAGSGIQIVDGKQVVASTLSSGQYPNITVQAGTPVKWVINAPEGSINGCNYQINIPEFGITKYSFQTGENVIEFNPTAAGKFQYSCWMGMIHGSITVTQAGAPASASPNPVGNNAAGAVPAGYQIPTDRLAIAKETKYAGSYRVQEVTVKLTEQGFSPAVVVVQSGMDVKWNIVNAASDQQSTTQILIPDYATKLIVNQGENPVFFSPEKSFDFSTGDNAYYGYVKVVDSLKNVDEAAVKKEVAAFRTMIWPPETFETGAGEADADAARAAESTVKDGVQYVTSTVSSGGYGAIRVQQGVPVKWTLKAPEGSLNGCNQSIVIPEYDLKIDLKTGDNRIAFTPKRSGTFAFSCWMGMVRSSITVVGKDGTVAAAQDDGSDELPDGCCG